MIKTARGIQKISSKIFLEHSNSSNYYRFGVEVFGPFLYSYTYWLYSSIKKTKQLKVFFLSRDGYMMKKAFDILNTDNIPCEYVYFSRKSIRQSLLNKCNTYSESLQYLTWERYLTFGKILEYYGFSENERFEISKKYKISLKADFAYSGLEDNKVLASIYYDLKSEIDKYSMLQEELLEKYLIQINMDGNCAIVDIGWHGSMQFYLEKFIKEKGMNVSLSGYYVGINPNVPLAGKTYGYLFDENNLRLRKSIAFYYELFLREKGYRKIYIFVMILTYITSFSTTGLLLVLGLLYLKFYTDIKNNKFVRYLFVPLIIALVIYGGVFILKDKFVSNVYSSSVRTDDILASFKCFLANCINGVIWVVNS